MVVDPEALSRWVPVVRDFVIVAVASFMLLYETVAVASPNQYVLGAAGMLLVSPAALRIDRRRRNGNGKNGNGTGHP